MKPRWITDGVIECPHCKCPIQRLKDGDSVYEALTAHAAIVHPEVTPGWDE